jgi:hypothetical protein
MTVLNDESAIRIFQLVTLRSAVKLEALGMKRRGRSATAITKDLFKLKRNLKSIEVLAVLDYAIGKINRGEVEIHKG